MPTIEVHVYVDGELVSATTTDGAAPVRPNPNRAKGERIGTSVLVASEVVEIRRLYKLGVKRDVLAKEFGISKANVTSILSGRTWGHVSKED